MTLPLQLLQRLRRRLRRRYLKPAARGTLREIEHWTGHRSRLPRTMKTIGTLLFLALYVLAVLLLPGCVTTTTTTRVTDAKGGMTETVVVTQASDPAALQLAGSIATAYAPPRARVIHSGK